ncbi:hypothetical protein CK203_033044 [Vitis vinifera]|uniref:Uncharacterized protein n=1 Tax=Vitis vinifera TaxID=29760 RepID=A0A438HVY2_VITVI|nr:hypothetical protein CK203_033044 [Vitis vinifera]
MVVLNKDENLGKYQEWVFTLQVAKGSLEFSISGHGLKKVIFGEAASHQTSGLKKGEREGCRVSGREEEQRRGIAACWKPSNIAQGNCSALSGRQPPSLSLPFPSLFLSLSFPFYITTATTASDPRLLPPLTGCDWCRLVAAGERRGSLAVVALVM